MPDANIKAPETRGIDGYIAPGWTKDAAETNPGCDSISTLELVHFTPVTL